MKRARVVAITPRKKHDYSNGGIINAKAKNILDRQHDQKNTERSIGEVHAEILKAVGTATADRKRKPVVQQGMQMDDLNFFSET